MFQGHGEEEDRDALCAGAAQSLKERQIGVSAQNDYCGATKSSHMAPSLPELFSSQVSSSMEIGSVPGTGARLEYPASASLSHPKHGPHRDASASSRSRALDNADRLTSTIDNTSSAAVTDTRVNRVTCMDQIPHSTGAISKAASSVKKGASTSKDSVFCQVCQDVAAGFYCGAFVCEACKKFFIRASKQEKQKFVCLRQGICKITKECRVQCQHCRYQKCLQLNMYYPGEGKKSVSSLHMHGIPCRVCGAPSSGFHFGALTCEGCKGFFRRMAKERDAEMYKCSMGGACEISTHTRNMCKACRYNKCTSIGMSVEGSRIGRQPNALKHAISLEVKKQSQQDQSLPLAPLAPLALPPAAASAGWPVETSPSTSCALDNPGGDAVHMDITSLPGPLSASVSDASSEVKEEICPVISFTDMQLAEVPEGVNIKEEVLDCEFEDQLLASSLEGAGKELTHMCMTDRAKSDVFDPELFESIFSLWKKLMRHFEFHAQCVLRFAKKVPGFRELLLDDQVILVQNAIYPIVVLNHSRRYELDTGFYNYFNFSKPEEEVVLQYIPDFCVLREHFKHSGMIAQTLKMTNEEYTLLSCLLLFESEVPGLVERDHVEKLQDTFINYFQVLERKDHGLSRFGEMMLRISELGLARLQHINTISNFLGKNPELEVPELYKEMFL